MKKIKSLFKRNYKGDRLVYNEVIPGSEWVLIGEGVTTIKLDGTACLIQEGKLYKRYDRKLTKGARKCHFDREGNRVTNGLMPESDFKSAPIDWMPCEESPNEHTGHWPGWTPIGDGPEDKWHREAWEYGGSCMIDGTYELLGPKVQGNPYNLSRHELIAHGQETPALPPLRNFNGLKKFFAFYEIEGIVWHHPDGRMAKIKRRDFGFDWPIRKGEK